MSSSSTVAGINFPSDVDEIEFAGLTSTPSVKLAAPRIEEAPCAMECRVSQILDYGRRTIVIGEVVQMYVRDEYLDRGRYVRPEVYQPIARLHADNYIVADNQFTLKKPHELLHHERSAGSETKA
ncbi:flavin reductase (DIM6/NTAB) family NADH-FMN oxidoreductase RutF [Aminobacter ciceronei]|uniref:Flavin reductase (DIM6/NTAB) family NADH-FMN oxidoreductase RutF n=1 Tax=Aminobacter ciceronei TaxID=150723 RepID=A0ABR6C0F0_9HYPH|nr:flavin reductase (DIM6/NTAB) family NADH-FMN oxidoreductase RutF [Aminobacter ciceronei]MBA9018445.1 flavin reductase (DIM6/NTAB) family NADH-FMN oxidoreductase RutF [Aminobacter ciceronei]